MSTVAPQLNLTRSQMTTKEYSKTLKPKSTLWRKKFIDYDDLSKTLALQEDDKEGGDLESQQLPGLKNLNIMAKEGKREKIIYRQDSLKQLLKNDSRRYFNQDNLEEDILPQMMKLDKYFSQTRKYILQKYSIKQDLPLENPQKALEKLTQNPLNFFRALESEKDKREFL